MNINLRALVFGTVVAASATVAIDSVVAAEAVPVVRLDGIEVTAHRDDAAIVRLDPVVVVARKDVI